MQVEMKVKGVMIDPVSEMPIIILKSPDGDAVLPIWVGMFEASMIAQQLEKADAPRPQTHALIGIILASLNTRVQRVVITDMRDSTYFALLYLERDGEILEIDARPSDAMLLALRAQVPILVEEAVLKASGEEGDDTDEAERLRKWLERVDPGQLGRYEM